ncbi:MAG: sulfatase-like hydrolase/transferase [Alistipes sp.]|nr:sulfatase-like hydrolase/transferase [Alistipes sp.]
MGRNILFILLLFLSVVVLSALQKPIFLLWYAELASDAEPIEFLKVVTHGLSLDMTMAGYVCALPILFVILSQFFPHRGWKIACRVWVYIASIFIAASFAVNLGLYEYWRFPLDGSILQYLATPKEAMASVTLQMFVVQSVVAVVYFAVMALLCSKVTDIFEPEQRVKWGRKLIRLVVFLLLLGIDFLAVRGGVTTAVANVSKAYFSENIVLNHAAVNPAFSFISSISGGDDFDRYNYFDSDVCQSQFSQIMGEQTDAPIEELLAVKRPNIVMILAESFGRSTVDEVVDGRAVAPEFQRLKSEGVWFENMIASSFRTDRGVLATLSGFCSQPTMSVMKYPQKASRLPSIAHSLKECGYATAYVHGGDLNFTDMAGYLYATGFEQLVALKDLSFDALTSKWGYADDVLADYFIDFVAKKAEGNAPYFAVWQTLSSHEPFDVPIAEFEDKMLNSMHFADRNIARVVEALRASDEWENTLVVIIADHAYLYPYGVEASAVARHRIPMLWLGGAIKGAKNIEDICSQTDLAATLLAQLGIDHSDFLMSRDIFAPSAEQFGYYTFNNGFGVVRPNGETIYDCTTEQPTNQNPDADDITVGKTMLQTTYNIIKQL